MGNIEPGAKVVLWSETRQPVQVWTAKMRGLITSLTFPGMVLDVKGMRGKRNVAPTASQQSVINVAFKACGKTHRLVCTKRELACICSAESVIGFSSSFCYP